MRIWKLAWRNIWRGRRSLVTISAMTFALWTMILYSALVAGYLEGMERNMLDMELGDLQIDTPAFRDDPSLYERIADPAPLLARLDALGLPAAPRLLGGALAAAHDASAGVELQGLELERDRTVSKLHQHVAQGQWLAGDDPHGVVVGRRLARTLEVKPGDELVVLSQGYDGSIANDLFRVRGVLQGISDGTDRGGVFLTAAAFRDFFGFPGGAHRIIVRRPADTDLEQVAAQVRAAAPGLEVMTWRELAPTQASLLDSMQVLMLYIFAIVYVAVGILLLNAMLMAVFERIREFGMLKALGVSPLEVFSAILVETGIQAALAVVIALALSVPALWYLSTVGIDMGRLGGTSVMGVAMDPLWRAEVTPSAILGPLLTLLCFVLVAVLYPAAKAALLDPVSAIRHQ